MPASNLIERVAELIAGGEELVPDAFRPELAELQRRLREPVRVAVVGRVSAGKSTMVNALLGQRVAPTDVSECTRLVTWFHYGHPQHLQIELKAGGTLDAQLTPDGTLPNTLDVPPEDVRALHCYLANDILKWMTLIDTPGIGSVHGEFSATTEELLAQEADSAAAAQRADAVVFLFNQVLMQDELEALQMFRAASGNDPSRSAASAVGVLSKADQLGDGTRDPWSVAIELAGVYAGKFRNEVAAVVPVVGLVAEASEAATLTELDAKQLAALAAMDEAAFAKLLWSTDRFVSADAPVSSEEARAASRDAGPLRHTERGQVLAAGRSRGVRSPARALHVVGDLGSEEDSCDLLLRAGPRAQGALGTRLAEPDHLHARRRSRGSRHEAIQGPGRRVATR